MPIRSIIIFEKIPSFQSRMIEKKSDDSNIRQDTRLNDKINRSHKLCFIEVIGDELGLETHIETETKHPQRAKKSSIHCQQKCIMNIM